MAVNSPIYVDKTAEELIEAYPNVKYRENDFAYTSPILPRLKKTNRQQGGNADGRSMIIL